MKINLRGGRRRLKAAKNKTRVGTLEVKLTVRDHVSPLLRQIRRDLDDKETREIMRKMGEAMSRQIDVSSLRGAIGSYQMPTRVEFPEMDRAGDDYFNIRFGLGYSGRYDHGSDSPYIAPTMQ